MTSAVAAPPSVATPVAPEVPPVPFGYAGPLPPTRTVRPLWASVVACAAGLVLLGIALYALQLLGPMLMLPRSNNMLAEVMVPMVGLFAGVCTLLAVVFLLVALRWLGRLTRAGA